MVEKTDRNSLEAEVRMHRLWGGEGGIVEMVSSGTRDPEEVARVLQLIKDKPDFILELKLKKGGVPKKMSESAFSRDMRWMLLENAPRKITSVKDFDLVSCLKKNETCVNGEEMVRRARQEFNANRGQEDAEWLLEHQNEIPKEWRNYYLTFPGTVWQGSNGYRSVPCLGWDGERWCLRFDWLSNDWNSYDRLLSACKSTCR